MNVNEDYEDARPAAAALNAKTWQERAGHWVRVIVMFLSGGFIFPHALTENDEPEAGKTPEKKP